MVWSGHFQNHTYSQDFSSDKKVLSFCHVSMHTDSSRFVNSCITREYVSCPPCVHVSSIGCCSLFFFYNLVGSNCNCNLMFVLTLLTTSGIFLHFGNTIRLSAAEMLLSLFCTFVNAPSHFCCCPSFLSLLCLAVARNPAIHFGLGCSIVPLVIFPRLSWSSFYCQTHMLCCQ